MIDGHDASALFRFVALIAWIVVACFMVRGALSAVFRGQSEINLLALGRFTTAVVFTGYYIRLIYAIDEPWLWTMLHVLSAANAVYIILMARAFRGAPNE